MCVPDAMREVDVLARNGVRVALTNVGGQCFARVDVAVPSPPWDRATYAILIPIPAAYSDAALDAFYIELPYKFNGGNHQRVSGAVVTLDDKEFQLVSWHYPDDSPWRRGIDTLESHIAHCRGFFLNRGAVNAIN